MHSRVYFSFLFIIACLGILLSGCFSYYERNAVLMTAFEQKNYAKAEEVLSTKKWEKRKKNRLLYYMNKGTILHLQKKYKESNIYFQKADYYIEDFQTKWALKPVEFVSNPSVQPYRGENFEQLLIHYYSTLNYLQMGMLDEALVECKRMQLKMQKITDYYKKENKYSRDAFSHLLLGIIYDAQKDYNSAFIAYRNAYEIYRDDYVRMLNTDVPNQLKKDLIRTAYLNGFYSESSQYEKEFGITYDKNDNTTSLVCFWNNGLGPVKDSKDFSFILSSISGGFGTFTNLELGLTIPVYLGNDQKKNDKLINLKVFKVSYPTFISRARIYTNASIENGSQSTNFETAENIEAIAYRSLQDRMLKEIGTMLARTALKLAAEAMAENQNEGLGAAVNLFNALTENADTRNWQMLPQSINYVRVPLNEGKNNLLLKASGTQRTTSDTLTVDAKKNQTKFHIFNTLN
ncbi:MAG: hypothetical protein J0M08_09480 [Bacteroidetes bacterium]|nr:hypothetical protein [Bacteroidota bacterium]